MKWVKLLIMLGMFSITSVPVFGGAKQRVKTPPPVTITFYPCNAKNDSLCVKHRPGGMAFVISTRRESQFWCPLVEIDWPWGTTTKYERDCPSDPLAMEEEWIWLTNTGTWGFGPGEHSIYIRFTQGGKTLKKTIKVQVMGE